MNVHAQPDASTSSDAGQPGADVLTDALLFLAAFHGRALSRDALLAGLPIEDGRLSPQLFSRAAQRAGLEVEPVKRALADIPALVLPAVLMMQDFSVRILLAIDKEERQLTILNPSDGNLRETVPFATVQANYLGYTFLARPASAEDPRTMAAGGLPRRHWFWSTVRKFWSNYSHVAVAAFIVNTLALATPLFIMNVYDRVIPNGAIASLAALAIGIGLAMIFDFILRVVRARIIDITGKKLDVVLSADIFEHVMSLKMAQRPTSVGVLANQLRDFESVREFFTSGTVVSATDLLFAVLFISVLFMIAGALAWVPLIMLPIMLTIGLVLQRPLDRAIKRLHVESATRHGILVESLSGIEAVRASAAEARMQKAWERSVAATARSSEDVQLWASFALTASSSAQQLTSLLLVIIGVFLILDGKLTVGALVASNMLASRVLAPISGIAAVITRATQTYIAMKAIDNIMALERERPPERSYVARKIERGSVVFDNVSFAYPGASEKALETVSFRVAPGERIGIIGRIGSGKTTVGRLLTGFYEPAEGSIQIDDVDIRQYDPADLRTGVGLVLQDTDLFFGNLRDNIALGKPTATDEDILLAARLAGVESFIAGHPLGYDMPVAEGGRSLSGGQKQAIGLARILIRHPKIIFLDEPTAHFDVRSEAEFIERLKTMAAPDTTVIISTHRLSLLSFVDRLLLLEKGRLVADGPRDEVLAKLRGKSPSGAPAASAAATSAPKTSAAAAPAAASSARPSSTAADRTTGRVDE